MKSLTLGKTGLVVSEIGFGGIPIIPLPFDEAVDVVRYCHSKGMTFFDTANAYVDSEKKIGQALESVRQDIVLATKTGQRTADGAAQHIGYSLDNLKTDYLDIYQFHNVQNETELDKILAPGGAYQAADQARQEGKIRFIGFSSHDIATAIKGCRTERFATVQFPFNFIEKDPADELFKVARELDMGIIGMKPLGGGLLERADLCFKFLQEHPYVLPIPGICSKAEADEIVDLYLNPKPLTEKEQQEIEQMRKDLGARFCHRCGYCLPCEQGVQIPGVMGFRSQSRRFPPNIAIAMTKAAMESVEKCIECGDCLDRCPYSLQIPELLREHLEAFEAFVARHAD